MPIPQPQVQVIETAVRSILEAVGESTASGHFQRTPYRVGKMLSDILDGNYKPLDLDRLTTFANDGSYKGIVIVHRVPFYSFCAHHLMPFFGHFALGYLPGDQVLGLSKLVRVFRYFCKKPTTQETITQAPLDVLDDILGGTPGYRGAMCMVTAEHTCMSMRGVQAHGAKTTTSAYSGAFQDDLALRQQFLATAQDS